MSIALLKYRHGKIPKTYIKYNNKTNHYEKHFHTSIRNANSIGTTNRNDGTAQATAAREGCRGSEQRKQRNHNMETVGSRP